MMTARKTLQKAQLALGVLCLSAMAGSAYADRGASDRHDNIPADVKRNIITAANEDARWSVLKMNKDGSVLTSSDSPEDASIICAHAGSKAEGWLALCHESRGNFYRLFFESDRVMSQLQNKKTESDDHLSLMLKHTDPNDGAEIETILRIDGIKKAGRREPAYLLYTAQSETASKSVGMAIRDLKELTFLADDARIVSIIYECPEGKCSQRKEVGIRGARLSLKGAEEALQELPELQTQE